MITLTERIYKGMHNGMDRVAYNLLVAKFERSDKAQTYINRYAAQDLRQKIKGIDLIIAISPRDSGSAIVRKMATSLGIKYRKPVILLTRGQKLPNGADRAIKGRNILIVDDVIFTGRTLNKAQQAVQTAQPRTIKSYALAKSKSFK